MKNSRRKYSSIFITVLMLVITIFSFLGTEADNFGVEEDDHVGLILNMKSREGKIVHGCILMSLSDFYEVHKNYTTRIMLHVRDSKGEPLNALSAALKLLDDIKGVKAIIGGQTRLEARFLAELGEKVKVPLLSLSELPPSKQYSHVVQIAQDGTLQFKCMASIIESFKWGDVILIYEDIDFEREIIFMMHIFQESSIHIKHKISLSASYKDEKVTEELHKLKNNKTSQNGVFVVHISTNDVMYRLVINAQKLGMMSTEGYAWFLSTPSLNLLHSMNLESMFQGVVVGLKPNIPLSKNHLEYLTSRLRKDFEIENPNLLGIIELSVYDSIWALAKAFERIKSKLLYQSRSNKLVLENNLEHLNGLDKILCSGVQYGFVLHKEILESKFKGLSGEVELINGRLEYSLKEFEIVNVIGKARRLGIWTYSKKEKNGTYILSSNDFEAALIFNKSILGRPNNLIPKRRYLSGEINLRIVVPEKEGFPELVKVDYYGKSKNVSNVTGFCVEVFRAALSLLSYHNKVKCHYSLSNESYDGLIYGVYLEKYDVAVGDITITSNRSNYVDFTLPFTELGSIMLVKNEEKISWIFLKPFSASLWVTTVVFFIFTGVVVWIIERPINEEFQGSSSHQIGMILWFSFSTLVFAHRERLMSNLSKFVVIVWVFVVLVLTSNYTATLSSMMTIEQINKLNSKGNYIAYQNDIVARDIYNNLNFSGTGNYAKPQQYADALSKERKHGGVSAIIDEIPYINIFLVHYPNHYSTINYTSTTNGFAFELCGARIKNYSFTDKNHIMVDFIKIKVFSYNLLRLKAFRKGSPIVDDMSRAIAKLREVGELENLEKQWFHIHDKAADFPSQNSSSKDNQNVLTVERFSGLFLMSGVSSTLALLLYLSMAFSLKDLLHFVQNFLLHFLSQLRIR